MDGDSVVEASTTIDLGGKCKHHCDITTGLSPCHEGAGLVKRERVLASHSILGLWISGTRNIIVNIHLAMF